MSTSTDPKKRHIACNIKIFNGDWLYNIEIVNINEILYCVILFKLLYVYPLQLLTGMFNYLKVIQPKLFFKSIQNIWMKKHYRILYRSLNFQREWFVSVYIS